MAFEIPEFEIGTQVAAVDLSTHQFKAVVMTATGYNLAGASVVPDGFLQNNPVAGRTASVETGGITKAIASEAIAVGDKVATAASGKVQVVAATEHAIGRAVTAAGADGEVLSIHQKYFGVQP